MKRNFDRYHKAKELPPLQPGDTVWIPETQSSGTVGEQSGARSYRVHTDGREMRRNRRHLVRMPQTPQQQTEESTNDSETADRHRTDETGVTRTRSGRTVNPPERLM